MSQVISDSCRNDDTKKFKDINPSEYSNFEIDLTRSSHGLLVNDDFRSDDKPMQGLKRNLTFFDGMGIIIGIIIGSGIFSSPGVVLIRAGNLYMMLLSWILSGLLVLTASQCYMELGTMLPSAGGDYDFIRRAFGDTIAFSFAWYYFFISKSGGHAIIATIFGRYINSILLSILYSPSSHIDEYSILGRYGNESVISKISSILIIIILSCINCLNFKEPITLQNILTSLKVFLLLFVFVLSTVYAISTDGLSIKGNIKESNDISINVVGLGSSMVACLWCFDGWSDLNFMQEELIDPSKDYVKTTVNAIIVVTIGYLITNIAYMLVLSIDEMKTSQTIVMTLGEILDSNWGTGNLFSLIFAVGVAVSTSGSLNGSILTGSRAFYAVAREGQAPSILMKLTSGGVPYMSVIGQAIWSISLLILPGSNFSSLLDYFGPMSWFYYALVCFAVIRLRNSSLPESRLPRPYVVLYYPIPCILVILTSLSILITSIVNEPLFTSLAIVSVGLSIPVHLIFFNKLAKVKDNNIDDVEPLK